MAPGRDEMDFYATQDGGQHWQRVGVAPAELSGDSEASQVFVDAKHGWLASSDGHLFSTADGAATWQKLESDLHLGNKESVSQIEFVDLTHGWLVKDILQDDNVYELLQTPDGGHTWMRCFGPEPTSAKP